MGVVVFLVVLLVGVIGMGRWRREQMLRTAEHPEEEAAAPEPGDEISRILGTKPTWFAPEIHWGSPHPARTKPPDKEPPDEERLHG